VPMFWILSVILAGATCLFLLLHSLSKPAVRPNPGVAAYTPPPGTRLIPLPRKSDAPELTELAAETPSPLSAFALAAASEKAAKRDLRPAARKRPRVDSGEQDQRKFGYAPPWNDGNRDWKSNRVSSSGFRPWF